MINKSDQVSNGTYLIFYSKKHFLIVKSIEVLTKHDLFTFFELFTLSHLCIGICKFKTDK